MAATDPRADGASLKKLLLGKLPPAEAQELYQRLSDPDALAALAARVRSESLRDAQARLAKRPPGSVDPRLMDLIDRLVEQDRQLHAATADTSDSGAGESRNDGWAFGLVNEEPDRLPFTQLGQYKILERLGGGGMGDVYIAEDSMLGRKVALKTMRPDLAKNARSYERFLREARAAAALDHDHIVPVFQIGEADGVPFLAMPLLRGEALDDRLRKGPNLNLGGVLKVAEETALGLAAAHDAGLLHRDIKPANLWLEADPDDPSTFKRVKILDFGLARTLEGEDGTRLTATGTIVGTAAYMAPEQARGREVDVRADLFSLGCVLYVLTTGKKPFDGRDTMTVLMALASHTPPPPVELNPALPRALSDLTCRLLEKKPEARPGSAREVVQEIRRIRAELAGAKQAPRPQPAGGDDIPMAAAAEPVPMPTPAPSTGMAMPTPDATSMPSNPWRQIETERPASARRQRREALTQEGGSNRMRLLLIAVGAVLVVGMIVGVILVLG